MHEVFEYLKIEVVSNEWLIDCSLILNSMSIRKQVIWDVANSKYSGFVDYANFPGIDGELASEALVLYLFH